MHIYQLIAANRQLRSLTLLVIVLFLSMQVYGQKTRQKEEGVAAGPMSCKIIGKVVSILEYADAADSGSICAKCPCYARVRIMELIACGQAVTVPLYSGDTIEIKFTKSLQPVGYGRKRKKAPGLKEGDTFSAYTEQRLKMGATDQFVIYDYTVKK